MENYEKKYKEALEQAKQELKACGSLNCDAARQIFRLFPELKESEDERIRKELIDFFKSREYNCSKRFISWLEKQGEQKSFDYENVNIQQKDFAPESAVEPKFKVGDWIVKDIGKDIFLITSYNSGYCTLEDTNGRFYHPCLLPRNDEFHLWTIRDAKNGDVLICNDDKKPFIFEGLLDLDRPDCPVAYGGIDDGDHFSVSSNVNWWTDDNVKPATKEQRNFLFQKMKEMGYKWNAEKKELTKL